MNKTTTESSDFMQIDKLLTSFLTKHKLPDSYRYLAESHFSPIAAKIANKCAIKDKTVFIALNGSQGSGKTTLGDFLGLYWKELGLRVLSLSLDDFYLSKDARISLSNTVHPLLVTRGVPGTHDTELMRQVLLGLRDGRTDIRIPRFDKATDDRVDESQWQLSGSRYDIVLIEGWCWGAVHESEARLSISANELEENEDADLKWRKYVNSKLKCDYEPLYELMECWLMLKAPSFNCVFQWRLEQEDKLRESLGDSLASADGVMSREQIARFVKHYERITNGILEALPVSADVVWELNEFREIVGTIDRLEKTTNKPYLVFTDLDGTLLDHHSYSFDAAKPMIQRLKDLEVPLIPNTSKTRAELIELREALDNSHPFITENGAAVYCPVHYFKQKPEDCILVDGYWVKAFALPRNEWQKVIRELGDEFVGEFKTFSELGDKGIQEFTDLSIEEARLANQRDFSEPLMWLGDEQRKHVFKTKVKDMGYKLDEGGRFLHMSTGYTKGKAMAWLKACYEQDHECNYIAIAAGDGGNDIAMLENADIPIVVRPHNKKPIRVSSSRPVITTDEPGPLGWNIAIEQILLEAGYIK